MRGTSESGRHFHVDRATLLDRRMRSSEPIGAGRIRTGKVDGASKGLILRRPQVAAESSDVAPCAAVNIARNSASSTSGGTGFWKTRIPFARPSSICSA